MASTAPNTVSSPFSSPVFKARRPTAFSPFNSFLRSISAPKNNPHARLPRLCCDNGTLIWRGLRISHTTSVSRKRVSAVSSLEDGSPNANPESEPSSSSSPREATTDIGLPRRSLIVQFTCNVCGERTQKVINRLAYERGTVFVQVVSSITN
ncbi:uncharacterized protein LOC131153127 isoform X2 [Malania oleifera]|uniref:uncharacterized protein LOC131153127 isoform X2 n=1 Tax=Malania oleifera TaxID=397392 RepID=UPI0025AEABC1|nr:uncharacterized protein LOC131153127 isoform X2 [Malania oleifera]